jgi:tetratricopeptide (TPR) repeat protein
MDEAGSVNRVVSSVVGDVAGAVVQAGSISGGVVVHQAAWQTVVPWQLPRSRTGFVGRKEQLAALDALVEDRDAVGILVVDGMAGVGKSSLVVHWAHRCADQFPDGQLYVDLRGFDPASVPMEPGEAIRAFLDALGVPGGVWPVGLDRQVGLYRSLLAGRRMLVVLDNARDSEQVVRLLPGSPSCRVVITSRYRLDGVVARFGARTVKVDVLSDDEASELLAVALGRNRVAADPESAAELVRQCAWLPIALAILAARLVEEPHLSLRALATELRDHRRRLSFLDCGEAGFAVASVFSWSYHALGSGAAALFRLLGLHPGPDFTLPALASLAGAELDKAGELVLELRRAHLVEQHRPGRYRMHDLLRVYARDRCNAEIGPRLRDRAGQRLLDHYLHTSVAADRHMDAPWKAVRIGPPADAVTLQHIGSQADALAWFGAEHAVLLGILEYSAALGSHHAWQLARAMAAYLDRGDHRVDFVHTQRLAIAAAERSGTPPARAMAHRLLGRALIRSRRYDEARGHLREALRCFEELNDRNGLSHTHYALGYLYSLTGNRAQALAETRTALMLSRHGAYRLWQAKALNNIGWCHLEYGEPDEALSHCLQALDLYRAIGTDPDGHAHVLECLGRAYSGVGEPRKALDYYQQALALCQQRGNYLTRCTTLRFMATDHATLGDHEAASAALREVVATLLRLNSPEAAVVQRELAALDRRV